MPDLLPILLLLSTIELAFTAYLWYFILSFIYRISTAFMMSTWESIGGIEVVTQTAFRLVVNTGVVLGVFMAIIGIIVMVVRQGEGRGFVPLIFG
jgi:hypothetical protein